MNTKYCSRCGSHRSTDEFYRCRSRKDGLSCFCKIHTRESQKDYEDSHPLLWVWTCMKQRCSNPKFKSYRYYGGKGIRVCQAWKDSLEAFEIWAFANGYRPGLTIDRIDSAGDYEPNNCRWITKAENSRNQSRCHPVEAFGETKTVPQWVQDPRCRWTENTLRSRLKRLTPEEAIGGTERLPARRRPGPRRGHPWQDAEEPDQAPADREARSTLCIQEPASVSQTKT